MRRRLVLGACALAALVAAAVLALLADAVFAVRDDLGTRAEALGQPAVAVSAGSPDGLRFRAARGLLGAGGDVELLEALEDAERARREELPRQEELALHAEAEAELARVVAGGAEPAVRSRAANLNGVLLVEDARLDPASASRFLQLGLEAFRRAATLDPGNGDAKYNLELLVGLLARGEGRLGAESGSEGASGAGASPEGSGY